MNITRDIERKNFSNLRNLYNIIESFIFARKINKKYNFIYFQNFEGLLKFLNEPKISSNKVNLIIDKDKLTFQTAKKVFFSQS